MSIARVYDLLAPVYRFLLVGPGLKKEQEAALRYVTGKRVLEVGCGTGNLLEHLASSDRSVVGLDISKGMLKQAAKRLAGKGKRISLIQGDYYRLPFPSNSFDCVVATFTLTHAPDLKPVLEEIAKVLIPGGRLVVVDVGPSRMPSLGSGLMTKAYRLLGDYVRDETKDLELAGFKIIHRRELSKMGTVHLVVAKKIPLPQA